MGAFPADSGNLKAVGDGFESVLLGDFGAECQYVFIGKFDDSATSCADQMVVGLLAETLFVVGLLHIESDLLEDAAIDEQGKGAVDGRFCDAPAFLMQAEEELLGFKVLIDAQDGFENLLAGRCESDAA